MALLGAAFFAACLGAQLATGFWAPAMLMAFNYEEAARGQNPNVTRFNESNILSERVLEQVIQRDSLGLSTEQLAGCLSISTPLDAEKLDVTQESDLKISTEYHVRCSPKVGLYGTDPKTVLDLLANVYWEDFVKNYAENDSILDLSFEKLDGMEYLDVKDYLEKYVETAIRAGVSLAATGAQIGVLLLTRNYLYYLVLALIAALVQNAAISWKADRLYPYLREKEVRPLPGESLKEMRRNVGAMLLHRVGTVVVFNTDNLLISKFVGVAAAGLYSIAPQ